MKKIIIIATIATLGFASCTDNQKARKFGGTETIKMMPNEKFINITWKQDNIWIITQDTLTGVISAREKSSFGVLEGKIIIEKP